MSGNRKNAEKEDETVSNDGEDDFKYEEVPLEDEWSLSEGEEDLEATVKAIKHRAEDRARAHAAIGAEQRQTVEEFLRNFLYQEGMTETLHCFQAEWTEVVQKGQVDALRVGVVPSIYTENQRLDSELKNAQREMEEYQLAAGAAAETLPRVRRARDLHRMQHKRVLQEKHRLIEEMRKLKVQCDNYEPVVKRMNDKYEALLRQTTLVTLERDKALAQVDCQSAEHNTLLCGDGRPPRSPGCPRTPTGVQ
uniref:Uncharacterized protein n=1 Tax=Anabas testudineus TaxID=64144 RepID=A0A3Q1IKI8_ANATE